MRTGKNLSSGEKIRNLRKKHGLSVHKLARQIHISGNYLSLIERGINEPSDQILFNLSEAFNIPPEELFCLYNKPVPPTDEQLQRMPSLKKIVTEISIDKRLSAEEKTSFINTLYELLDNLEGGDHNGMDK